MHLLLFSASSQACKIPTLDLVFLIDASTSVGARNFARILEFVKTFLGFADIDSGQVRVGVAVYSTAVEVEFHLNR